MDFATAKESINWIFGNIPENMSEIEISFIGGEPLLEFDLLKNTFEYAHSLKAKTPFIMYATTNGTILTNDMKKWLSEHRQFFWLGLSLDGTRETHNYNRCNSFDDIDIDFFRNTWPTQGVKMTLSEYSIPRLSENIKFIHTMGFSGINGVNLYEGDFDWNNEEYIKLLIPQFISLVDFYVENDKLQIDQMLDRHIEMCILKAKNTNKWCGIGEGTIFFDTDGKRYPCSFITPMTFSKGDIDNILTTDFSDMNNFLDADCYNSCFIYPICPTCSGADYLVNKKFNFRAKSKCRIHKLIALFAADLQGKLIKKNPHRYDDETLYYVIEAIKQIKHIYLPEFKEYI
jgi:radical SAM protein with 4Fe4S-binding SPASM domain